MSCVLKGLEKGIDYKKVLKAFKKDFCCNGTVVEDTELGQVRYYIFMMFLPAVLTTCPITIDVLTDAGHSAAR